ncbi:hypothetical protein P7C73_g3562, partial [Tremellales sp. Uapishka_1]
MASSSSSSTSSSSVTSGPRRLWRESRARAKKDRSSWDYVLSSGVAGGISGCVAKTAIAPLDRVKILFQTSNAEFRKYAGTPWGLLGATAQIYKTSGVWGLFQGHSATLLRIFPYAAVKFMTYDALERVSHTPPAHMLIIRFSYRRLISAHRGGFLWLAQRRVGPLISRIITHTDHSPGVTSVLCVYPLDLIRVRLAYQTSTSSHPSLYKTIQEISREARATNPTNVSAFTRSLPFYPFYRGFSVSIIGMIPYAGVSFLTYGTLKRHIPHYIPYLADRPTIKDLTCGAVAGLVSQTASYPFEVVRRRMQVGGVAGGAGITWREAVKTVYASRGWRGFFVGLSIGYLKVIPMSSISFTTWQFLKRVMEL